MWELDKIQVEIKALSRKEGHKNQMTTATASFHRDDDHVISAVTPALRMNLVRILRWISFLSLLSSLTKVTARQLNPQPGDVCGEAGQECFQLRCACGLCPDGVTKWGCCDDCVYNEDMVCQNQRSFDCPLPPAEEEPPSKKEMQPGDVCGVPGEDCIQARCACRPCPDGVNFFGCCNDCVLSDELQCQHVSSCPPQPGQVCGISGIDCPGLKCPCGLCEDGVNVYGCCSDCVYAFVNDKLECQSISTCPSKPKPGEYCGKAGVDCPIPPGGRKCSRRWRYHCFHKCYYHKDLACKAVKRGGKHKHGHV